MPAEAATNDYLMKHRKTASTHTLAAPLKSPAYLSKTHHHVSLGPPPAPPCEHENENDSVGFEEVGGIGARDRTDVSHPTQEPNVTACADVRPAEKRAHGYHCTVAWRRNRVLPGATAF